MLTRLIRHVIAGDFALGRAFSRDALARIGATVAEEERRHSGELRFVVEGGLSPWQVLKGQSAHDQAVELFSALRVWDTEHNNGVLIYVLLADRTVEIIADRGIHARVGTAAWGAICGEMQRSFAGRKWEEGAMLGLKAVSDLLSTHFPADGVSANPNELPDQPVVL